MAAQVLRGAQRSGDHIIIGICPSCFLIVEGMAAVIVAA
jgi:hypothetical protein